VTLLPWNFSCLFTFNASGDFSWATCGVEVATLSKRFLVFGCDLVLSFSRSTRHGTLVEILEVWKLRRSAHVFWCSGVIWYCCCHYVLRFYLRSVALCYSTCSDNAPPTPHPTHLSQLQYHVFCLFRVTSKRCLRRPSRFCWDWIGSCFCHDWNNNK
jgi:hypothetical protein